MNKNKIDILKEIDEKSYNSISSRITEFRPCQTKALESGLLNRNNLLICTPTASGKTLIAEMAILNTIRKHNKKAIYVAPLKALASEKYREFKKLHSKDFNIKLSVGDYDDGSTLLQNDLILTTSEKLDSLIRHNPNCVSNVKLIVVDEIHLLNDAGRGPTLEIMITLLKRIIKELQVVGLSATIGNPKELADWLDANLVIDNWRPVELKEGIMVDNTVTYYP